ncbi:MAG: PEPxxWA-CTERM sorting domain-containing protein [Pseudomonadota bacterium]
MKKTILAALAAGMAMVSAPASAVTTVDGTASGSTAGGPLAPVLFEELNPVTGQNVGVDPFDLPSLFFLRERTNVTVGSLSSLVNLSADTVVDSFYILFDPASTNPATTLFGEVVFGEEILAIITDTDDLEDTDSAFGLNTVNYGTSDFRGLEGNDDASFVGNELTVEFVATSPGDFIRVLTVAAPVPEPSTWLMLLLGFGLVGGALRAQREKLGVQAKFAI